MDAHCLLDSIDSQRRIIGWTNTGYFEYRTFLDATGLFGLSRIMVLVKVCILIFLAEI